ncbi:MULTISPECIES: winged helix-turn-helix domain-containing protein [unclassified Paenibacillus]|uniref:winged helix-turn-helix domain-containing protein n=1 Tax=unclassified Paenibacillus TaxID=185978 RepID=UPI0030FA4827
MGFTEEHRKWVEDHISRRTGERRGRLERGHGHGERMFAEKVWWPMMGHFDDLHPEYEVLDWRGWPYFVDFAWKPGQVKFAFEVKGYGPHVQNTDRTRYRQELNRETYLQIAGYRVVAIPYDDLEVNPENTIFLLRSLLMPYLALRTEEKEAFSRLERDILQIAVRSNGDIRPVDLVRELGIDLRTVRKCMRSLCEKGKFKPIVSQVSGRVCRYEYVHSLNDIQLW